MQLWTRPLLREDAEEERRVEWIELFFDLAFVALVSALAAGLSRHIAFVDFARYALLFASMWVVWRYGAIYADRFETDDFSYRASLLALMAAVLTMTVGAEVGFVSGFRVFAAGYVAASVLVMTLWLRGGRHNPRFRPLAKRLTVFHCASIALWVVAAAVGLPVGWWVAAAALAVDLSAPLVTARRQDDLPRLSMTHLPERFGLFTIIVLGEAVIATAAGLSGAGHQSVWSWIAAVCTLVLITGLYWLYFDQVMSPGTPPSTALLRNLTQYLHLPLAMAIATVSAVIPEYVNEPWSPLSTSSRLLLSLGFAVVLLSIALLEAFMVTDAGLECLLRESRILEIIGAAVLVVLGVAVPGAPAIALFGAAAVIVVGIIVRGAIVSSRGVCEL